MGVRSSGDPDPPPTRAPLERHRPPPHRCPTPGAGCRSTGRSAHVVERPDLDKDTATRPLPAVTTANRGLKTRLVAALLILVVAASAIGFGVLDQPEPPAIDSPLAAVDQIHGGHFVVKASGATFVVRGFDYQPLLKLGGTGARFENESFSPLYYRHGTVAAMLASWESEGYNTARVLVAPGQIGNALGRGLSPAYVADLADFVATARAHDIRTLIAVGALPTNGGFVPASDPEFGTINEDYLNPLFIEAENRYLETLIGSLRRDGAPLVDVLWELKGEQQWDNDSAPLRWTAGSVTTANGRTYDMASAASRTAMENAGLVYWTNRLTATIHRLVPGSLVGVGSYPVSVKRPEWTVQVSELFKGSTATNFVDVHLYPNLGSEEEQIESFHASGTTKPVIMGEFGAVRSQPIDFATASLVSWQERSCDLGGISISGWLLWTWNSSAQKEFWDATASGGALARALSPARRPNPCT